VKVEFVEETSVRKALAFEIEPDVVEREIGARARDYARRVKIPGFRPGKIPPAVIKQRLRQEVLGDVAETIVNRVVFQELEGRGLRPLAAPKVQDLKIDENQPMTFRAVFETLPLIEVPEYKGLPAKGRQAVVSEEQVQAEVDRLREEHARFDPVEGRPVRKGDFAVVDLAWRPTNGKGGRDENALMEAGGAGNHEDMNRALEGMAVGETKEVDIAYPENFEAKSVAGRTVHYVIAVKAIKEKVVPAADDEFAKDLDLESLAALISDVRARLLGADERKADREIKSAIVDDLVQRSSFEVPEVLIERHMTARTENAARGLALQGIDPTKIGVNWRDYRETQREEAVKAAKADILLDEIARREGVLTLDAEVDAEVDRLAVRLKQSKEKVRAQMEKEGDLESIRARIREEKTLDLLKANARLDLA
jgi:trigger factor